MVSELCLARGYVLEPPLQLAFRPCVGPSSTFQWLTSYMQAKLLYGARDMVEEG